MKWHLGYASWDFTPTSRGFNTHFGYFQGEVDYFNKTTAVIETNHNGSGFDFWFNRNSWGIGANGYSLDQFTLRAREVFTDFSKDQEYSNRTERLFLYLAEQTVHVPLVMARQKGEHRCNNIRDNWRRVYCSMLVELDDSVGALVNVLKMFDMYNETVIFVVTDNGAMVRWQENSVTGEPSWPASAGSNAPFRGSKATLFEGGIRGTGFVSGGYVPTTARGTTYHGLMHIVDIPVTAFEVATRLHGSFSMSAQEDRKRDKMIEGQNGVTTIDGINHWDELVSSSPTTLRSDLPLNIIYGGKRYSAVRFDYHYKLIVGEPYPYAGLDGWRSGGLYPTVAPPFHVPGMPYLFNITADPEERNELTLENCPSYPELIAKGMAYLESIANDPEYREPQSIAFHPSGFPDQHDGVWAPFCSDDCI